MIPQKIGLFEKCMETLKWISKDITPWKKNADQQACFSSICSKYFHYSAYNYI